ncbi:MAG: hypothetical protein IPL10_15225 [Bacteroidetes bacterium]|nr:hypothetical protein [Bacteroidota bacterium]
MYFPRIQLAQFIEIPEIGSLTESANNYFRSFLFDETVFDYIRLEDYQSKMGNDLESFDSIPNELKLQLEEIKIKNTCINYYLEYLDQFYFRPFQVD